LNIHTKEIMKKPLLRLYAKKITSLLTFLLLLLFSVQVSAQNRTVTGTVTSQADNEALPGVIITTSEGKKNTTTDSEGKFSIEVTPADQILIRMIGFSAQTITVGTRTNLIIRLTSTEEALNEIVVVGYGTQKKANLTGAISSINPEAFKGRSRSHSRIFAAGTNARGNGS
jgi:hypothetical protein